MIDIAAVKAMADRVGAMLVVDNTFATPYHQHPLALGADLVVHSATKALGGHNDLMAGAIAGSKEDYDKLWFTRQAIGTTLDAYSASLLERGLKTFPLRAERMAANAMAVARHLVRCRGVSNLRYPGLKESDGHRIAARADEARLRRHAGVRRGQEPGRRQTLHLGAPRHPPRGQPGLDGIADLHPVPDDDALHAARAAHDLRRQAQHRPPVRRHRAVCPTSWRTSIGPWASPAR